MKTIIISIIIVIVLIGGAIFITKGNSNSNSFTTGFNNNVSIKDGKQIIEIHAKGGYFPKNTIAQADFPTIIKVVTKSSFDCSSALVIPSLNYRTNLPMSGEIFIDVPSQKAGTKLQGLCAMGMYSFTIDFN